MLRTHFDVYYGNIQPVGVYDELINCEGFDWDDGNRDKNWRKHRVSDSETEQIFFNEPLVAATDPAHSTAETRFYALGQTDGGRQLFVAFTIRNARIRVVSSREMTRRERRRYDRG